MVCDGCNNRLDDADTLRIWGMPKHGEHTSGQQVALYLILTVVRTQSVSMSFYCGFLLQNCGFLMNTEAAEGLGYRSGDVVKLSGWRRNDVVGLKGRRDSTRVHTLPLTCSCQPFVCYKRQWGLGQHFLLIKLQLEAVRIMFLPRDLIAHLYNHLTRSHHAQSPPVLLLVALEPDALCACRILTALLKRDYIPHNIIPVSGYGDLARSGETQVQPMRLQNGGSGGTVICLGVGGLVDLAAVLGLEATEEVEDGTGGVEIWVIDARRPWNLGNVFGGKPPDLPLREGTGNGRVRAPDVDTGQIQQGYRPGRGGIIVYDDGDIREELGTEREAYFKLDEMPVIEDDGQEPDDSDSESENGDFVADSQPSKKRKSLSDADEDEESDEENERPRQRQRSNSVGLGPYAARSTS